MGYRGVSQWEARQPRLEKVAAAMREEYLTHGKGCDTRAQAVGKRKAGGPMTIMRWAIYTYAASHMEPALLAKAKILADRADRGDVQAAGELRAIVINTIHRLPSAS